MAIDYDGWFANPNHDECRVMLVDVKVYTALGEVTRKLSTAPITLIGEYLPLLNGSPVISTQLSAPWVGRSSTTIGDLDIVNDLGDYDDWLNDGWSGRDISIKVVDGHCWTAQEIEDAPTILVGTVHGLQAVDDTKLRLRFHDRMGKLDKDIQENTMDDGDNGERVIPLCYGEVFHVRPYLIDKATRKYKVHDGPIESVVAVYEDYYPTTRTVTPNLSDGTFTLDGKVRGNLTAHIKGAKPSTYLTKPGEIMLEIIKTHGGLTDDEINLTQFAAFDADAPDVGIYIDDRANILDVLDQIVLSHYSYAFYGVCNAGKMWVNTLAAPVAADSLATLKESLQETSGDLQVEQLGPPRWKTAVNYKRCWVTSDKPGDSVLDEDIEWIREGHRHVEYIDADRTTIELQHLDAENPEPEDTLIVSEADALLAATARQALLNTPRFEAEIDAFALPYLRAVGDVITLYDDRYGFSAGRPILIKGIEKDPMQTKTTITGWY